MSAENKPKVITVQDEVVSRVTAEMKNILSSLAVNSTGGPIPVPAPSVVASTSTADKKEIIAKVEETSKEVISQLRDSYDKTIKAINEIKGSIDAAPKPTETTANSSTGTKGDLKVMNSEIQKLEKLELEVEREIKQEYAQVSGEMVAIKERLDALEASNARIEDILTQILAAVSTK